MPQPSLNKNQAAIKFHQLSERLGISADVIAWIHFAVVTVSERKSREENKAAHARAREVCVAVVRDAVNLYEEPVKETMERLNLPSSESIGAVVFALVEEGLLRADEDDRPEDIDGIFTTRRIEDFLKTERIKLANQFLQSFQKEQWSLAFVGIFGVSAAFSGVISNDTAYGVCLAVILAMAISSCRQPDRREGRRF